MNKKIWSNFYCIAKKKMILIMMNFKFQVKFVSLHRLPVYVSSVVNDRILVMHEVQKIEIDI